MGIKTYHISWDRYGYISDITDVTDLSERDRLIHAAACQNYWWEQGGLDSIPGSWSLISGTEAECQAEIQAAEIQACGVAWQNGNDHCQCGHPECPRYKED